MAVMRCSSTSSCASSRTSLKIGFTASSRGMTATNSTTPSCDGAHLLVLVLEQHASNRHMVDTICDTCAFEERSASERTTGAKLAASASTLLSSSCTTSSSSGSTLSSASHKAIEDSRSGTLRMHTSRRSGCWLRAKAWKRQLAPVLVDLSPQPLLPPCPRSPRIPPSPSWLQGQRRLCRRSCWHSRPCHLGLLGF